MKRKFVPILCLSFITMLGYGLDYAGKVATETGKILSSAGHELEGVSSVSIAKAAGKAVKATAKASGKVIVAVVK